MASVRSSESSCSIRVAPDTCTRIHLLRSVAILMGLQEAWLLQSEIAPEKSQGDRELMAPGNADSLLLGAAFAHCCWQSELKASGGSSTRSSAEATFEESNKNSSNNNNKPQ